MASGGAPGQNSPGSSSETPSRLAHLTPRRRSATERSERRERRELGERRAAPDQAAPAGWWRWPVLGRSGGAGPQADDRQILAGTASAEAALRAAAAGPGPGPGPEEVPAEPEFPAPGEPKAAAFFDLDNTVMRGATVFHFGRGLYKRKFFRKRELLRFAWQQAYFRLAGAEHAGHMRDAQDSALSIVRGHRVSELMAIGEEIYDEYLAGRIWSGTRALAQAHLDAGQRVWLVTAAPVETATIIARRLGLTGALGTVAESVGGVYTGRLVGEVLHGPAKAVAVRALAESEDLDLSRCAAYSDSSNDIPMLSLVGHPYAINPDAKLRAHAREMGWRLRDYRTGRKAVRIGVPAAAGAGAVVGGTAAALALQRRRR